MAHAYIPYSADKSCINFLPVANLLVLSTFTDQINAETKNKIVLPI